MDDKTGEMAESSKLLVLSCTIVSWGRSGVKCCYSVFVNPAYGPEGIKLMESGVSAEDA